MSEIERQDQIHLKGFDMSDINKFAFDQVPEEAIDYSKIKVGVKNLEDAVIKLGDLSKNGKGINKGMVLRALGDRDIPTLRRISEYFYNTSGIYMRVCNYIAQLYRYDWYIIPEINDENIKKEKILKDYSKILKFLDNSYIKKITGEMALKVVKYGCYYGYVIPNNDHIIIQELPPQYCRTRYFVNGLPAIEFNMAFFDDKFADIGYRMRVLKMFPEDFQKGYALYKQGKLGEDDYVEITGEPPSSGLWSNIGTTKRKGSGWYLLDIGATIKFNLNGSDVPLFASAIPSIIDLDAAQDLDRRKQMQQLLKILIQKLPLDKNGDLIFDVDEARDIHNNAVQMLKRAVGVDVLTTFADIEAVNMSDKNTTSTQDDLAKVERTVYNSFGVSRNLFNTDGNLSLEKSILDDQSAMRDLLLQFIIFYDRIVQSKISNKSKYSFRFNMLNTTDYNYKDIAKMLKEQVQSGYSKILPQIALGFSQSSLVNQVYFENEILELPRIMIPPLISTTLNSEDILGGNDKTGATNLQDTIEPTSENVGRPEIPEDEKSDKTLQNLESQS